MDNKNIFLWTLYDFANSIVSIVFFLYFSQWLVIDRGVADFWYNMIFAVGSVLLLLTAPVLGSIADKTGRQQNYFNRITVLSFACFLAVSLIALFFSQKVFLAALFFLLANYLYQFSFVFYNAFLYRIAPPERWGRVSGLGIGANYLGQVVGLLITLPLAGGTIYLIGEVGRAQTFLPATILFFVLALPMILYFKLPKQENLEHRINLKEEYRSQWRKFKELISDKNMKLFLLAFFFFNDAIITLMNNFPIYLQNVFGVSDKLKTTLLGGALITSIFGAILSGFIIDRMGLKKSLLVVIGVWVIFLPILGLNTNFNIFMVLCILMGFLFGAIWTVTRAVMTALTPKEKLNFGFSFYTLAERTSTLVGPLFWGLITYIFIDLGPARYRIAVIVMAVFVAVGFYFVRKVQVGEVSITS
ncbi:MAG: MFS transporter [Candidatus Yanofskybacteria bacterium]|nr:MFS transporter [Candidatus Yanofskybacteria bacterium]